MDEYFSIMKEQIIYLIDIFKHIDKKLINR